MAVLVTGGAGYIGSHTVCLLLEQGDDVVVIDNLSNASSESLVRVFELTGRSPVFCKGDILDESFLEKVFSSHAIDSVIHFAGLKAVGESVEKPLLYYENNVNGTLALCRQMEKAGVRKIIFSSSATVYGESDVVPMHEGLPTGVPSNPYGHSKLMVETILKGLAQSDDRWSVSLLRYFNPIGAHPSGRIGEDPLGIPNNLVPFVAQVAAGRHPSVKVFGDDYPTNDGTGVRDYIHVMDLAEGHVRCMDHMKNKTGVFVCNLGTGKGYSVFQVIRAFEKEIERKIPYEICPRRLGDIASCWASTDRAAEVLGFEAKRDLSVMVADTWRWQSQNPMGYRNA